VQSHRPVPNFNELCSFTTTPLRDGWPSFLLAHYPNGSTYDNRLGNIWTPWNTHYYDQVHYLSSPPPLSHSFCQFEEVADGLTQTWNVERVGPLESTGGYDWWQMTGYNAMKLKPDIVQHESLFLTESFFGAVSTEGIPLSYPPIHLHHIHMTPGFSGLRWVDPTYKHLLMYERHGEWTHVPDVGTEREPLGYGKKVHFPLALDAEVNDARPANSPPLRWYLQFAVRWVPGSVPLTPISFIELMNFREPSHIHQSEDEAYFFIKPYEEIVSWYSGKLPALESGKILYVKVHVHENAWFKGRLLSGNLGSVGLAMAPFTTLPQLPPGKRMAEPQQATLQSTPFATFDELDQMLSTVEVQCVFTRRLAVVDGYCYDRAPVSNCTEWIIQPGDEFTAVNYIHYKFGMPDSECPIEPWLTTLPARFPMHTEYFIATSAPTTSCYVFYVNVVVTSFSKSFCSTADKANLDWTLQLVALGCLVLAVLICMRCYHKRKSPAMV